MGDAVDRPGTTENGAILAAISDLAPVVVPGATLDGPAQALVIALPDHQRATVSLHSLIGACRGALHTHWPRLIADWLGTVVDDLGSPSRPPTLDDLRVRLVPTPESAIEGVITRAYGPHFQLQLMADLPDRRAWVTDDGAEALAVSPADAFSAGLRNTVTKVLVGLDIREHALPDGTTVSLAAADGVPWVSTGLTSIAQLFRTPQLPFGALVAAPRTSAVLFQAVSSTRALDTAPLLERLTKSMHHDSDDACSPTLWWFDGGAFHPIGVDGRTVTIDDSLRELVARLPRADP